MGDIFGFYREQYGVILIHIYFCCYCLCCFNLASVVEKGVMDADFENAAFALQKVGDRTGLVKSSFGYHIIQLDEIKAPQAKPYADVADDIKSGKMQISKCLLSKRKD